MCRKCYVNPVVVEAFLAGELRQNVLRGGGNGRVRLLQLLSRTPAGVGFTRVPAQVRNRTSRRNRLS
jgi:hypothetical protein